MVADSDAWGQLMGIFDGAGGAFLPHARAAFPAFARARAMAVKTAAPSPFARLALLQNASRQLGGLLSQADKEPGTAGVSED